MARKGRFNRAFQPGRIFQADTSKLWLDCTTRDLTSDPLIMSALQQLSVNPYDIECVQYVQERIRSVDMQDILDPDPFRRINPTTPSRLTGPINLGIVHHSGVAWGIHPEALTEHLCCVGRTGGGKTTVIKIILKHLLRMKKHKTIIIFDRKQDFYDLAIEFRLLYFLLEDFMDNWCAPPYGVDSMTWFNILAEILTASFELHIGAQFLIIDVLKQLSRTRNRPKSTYPTLRELTKHLFVRAEQAKGSARETLLRLGHRTRTLVTVFGNAASSHTSLDWRKLSDFDLALSLAGLAPSLQNLCITIYFAKLLLYRIYNNLRSDKLEALIVLDEASMIFPKTGSKKTSMLLDYFQQARAFGIGVIFASQSMNLADEIFANTAIKIAVGGFGHGSDYEAFGSAVGLNRGQRDFMRTISQPGSAVVKDIRNPHPFTLQIHREVI